MNITIKFLEGSRRDPSNVWSLIKFHISLSFNFKDLLQLFYWHHFVQLELLSPVGLSFVGLVFRTLVYSFIFSY